MLPGDKPLWLMLGTAGAALAMLRPGLWSIDARLTNPAPPLSTVLDQPLTMVFIFLSKISLT